MTDLAIARRVMLTLAMLLLWPITVAAQRVAPVGVTARSARLVASDSMVGAAVPDSSRARRVGKGALVGAGVGAGVGLVTAIVLTASPRITDHSEDSFAYVVCVGIGALAGLLVGAFVGAVSDP